jgi:hypothetical protein
MMSESPLTLTLSPQGRWEIKSSRAEEKIKSELLANLLYYLPGRFIREENSSFRHK